MKETKATAHEHRAASREPVPSGLQGQTLLEPRDPQHHQLSSDQIFAQVLDDLIPQWLSQSKTTSV